MQTSTIDKHSTVAGMRILVVEDEYLASLWITRALHDFGCAVIGPAPTVDRGSELAANETLHGAILDVNVHGEHSGRVADLLDSRGCPFFFVTGYSSPAMLPQYLRERRRLYKPVGLDSLLDAIVEEFAPDRG